MNSNPSRRNFLRLGSGVLASIGGFSRLGMMNALAQSTTGYRALVCIFMTGGNDGHNTVIPQASSAYSAYKSIRGTLSLPDTNAQLLPITNAADGTPYALNNGLLSIHPLWAQGRLAVVANVGMLVKPTSRTQYIANSVPVPTNLFSHSDQVLQMQSGVPNTGAGTGWAGRMADAMQSVNATANFPPSFSMNGPALFSVGNAVQTAALIPGLGMSLYGFDVWPSTAAAARSQALQEILTFSSGLAMVQAANQVRQDALNLDAQLKSLANSSPLKTVFPGTNIGQQLQQVAQVMQLRTTTGIQRQIFFCSIGGFDTHGSQSWMQWDLLRQMADAMLSFYNATVEMGIANQVTTFTESEFGRTLQPSGSGSDHGWGNHHLVMGGAVKGGNLFGAFPTMALGGPDDANTRGVLIPSTALDQYGATFGKWFGLDPAALNTVFPNLVNFPVTDLGFLS